MIPERARRWTVPTTSRRGWSWEPPWSSGTGPSLARAPTYCTDTLSPALTAGPVPSTSVVTSSAVGGAPGGTDTVGLSLADAVGTVVGVQVSGTVVVGAAVPCSSRFGAVVA